MTMYKADKVKVNPATIANTPLLIVLITCVICAICGFWGGRLYEQNQIFRTVVDLEIAHGLRKDKGSFSDTGVVQKLQVGGVSNYEGKGVCTDSCNKARDGVCDDGRLQNGSLPESAVSVFCDLGTDCTDCGPWQPSDISKISQEWLSGNGPIGKLKKKNVQVFVKKMVTQPAMLFAYTDKDTDFDVSFFAHKYAGVELGITLIFSRILKEKCATNPRTLFVDVGANFGWFTAYVAKLGCRVIAFEPVPQFRAFLEYNLAINGLQHLVDVRSELVSEQAGGTLEMVVPTRGIWGTAGIGGANIDESIDSAYEKLHIPSVRLDDVIHEDVTLLKVDVEGYEWSVLKGAQRLLKEHDVQNIIMEYSPGVAERKRDWKLLRAMVGVLSDFLAQSYTIAHIGEGEKHMDIPDWNIPLRRMKEVTARNLKYDLEDIRYEEEKGGMGCPTPPELKKFQAWQACDALPEDLHPKSFRSELSHNTNIWAAKNRSELPLEGIVGIFPMDKPTRGWWSERPDKLSTGLRHCDHLMPQYQVRHRCHCTKPEVCGEEEKVVQQLIQLGRMPASYEL